MRMTKVYSYISLAIVTGIIPAGSISCTGKQEKSMLFIFNMGFCSLNFRQYVRRDNRNIN
jgi:hypothetical protein